MSKICILMGGPDRTILDARGRKWTFEDHPQCGPVVIGKRGDPLENQPPESSPFWEAVNNWYSQGKRTRKPVAGETWCVWDRPTMPKMRHMGGRHYMLICDDESKDAGK